ncbi:ATP-binding protein [Desulfococcaceae bacterium HSG8]|nr:ATP-binding protein [Desulfococcaceae bacterium HSG8]
MINPYVWNEVRPEMCYGRDGQLGDLLSGLAGTTRYSFGIAGGRRMGKSTLLRRAETDIQAGVEQWLNRGMRVMPIYIDGLSFPRPLEAADFWGKLLRKLQEYLPKPDFNPKMPVDFSAFKDIIKPILQQLPEQPRIIVLFDEIEPITVYEWSAGFWANWRALLSNTPGLSEYFTAVFAGAHEIADLRHDVGSPLADILEWQSLRCLDFEDARTLMCEPVEKEWPESFLKLVYEETGGHPFLLQYVMHQVCKGIEEDWKESLDRAVKKFKKERYWQFSEWWEKYCTDTARRLYRCLPDDGSAISRRRLVQEFGVDAADKGLEILQHVGLAASEDDDFAFRYTGEMFRRWYRLHSFPPVDDIQSLISVGESDSLEFKSSIRWDYHQEKLNKSLEKVILKTIAGFMNADGGKLLIGVDDEGNILGLEKDFQTLKKKDRDGFELFVIQLLSNGVGKEFCPYIHLTFDQVDVNYVCLINVDASPKPAYVREGNETRFFLRTGASTQLNTKEAIEYVSAHWEKV